MLQLTESHTNAELVRDLIGEYLDLAVVRRFLATGGNLQQLRHKLGDRAPHELHQLLDVIGLLLQPSQCESIQRPEDIAAFLMVLMGHLEQRHVAVLLLDAANHITASRIVAIGSDDAFLVQMKDVFRPAVQGNAHTIVVAMHRLTDVTPTDEEVALVERIIECGDILGIHLQDAMVVSRNAWTSIRLLHPDLEWSERDG